ncbi:MAG: hypothetical protein IJA60_05510 [Clostridia bacterium]|nr:hypothetical protein [Clostridia bacterium]
MLLNLEWTIPAWILLALHFILGVPIVWFWVALAVWLLSVLLWTDIFGRLNALGNIPDKPKENKNPYSYKEDK